jgi:hypothetical protein
MFYLDELIVTDERSELLALVGVVEGHVTAGLHQTHGAGGQDQTLKVKPC